MYVVDGVDDDALRLDVELLLVDAICEALVPVDTAPPAEELDNELLDVEAVDAEELDVDGDADALELLTGTSTLDVLTVVAAEARWASASLLLVRVDDADDALGEDAELLVVLEVLVDADEPEPIDDPVLEAELLAGFEPVLLDVVEADDGAAEDDAPLSELVPD